VKQHEPTGAGVVAYTITTTTTTTRAAQQAQADPEMCLCSVTPAYPLQEGLDASMTNQVLVEMSLLGWKEFELEVGVVLATGGLQCTAVCTADTVNERRRECLIQGSKQQPGRCKGAAAAGGCCSPISQQQGVDAVHCITIHLHAFQPNNAAACTCTEVVQTCPLCEVCTHTYPCCCMLASCSCPQVMRDLADNVVIICSIENVDPMGVHTGE
jgi:hypothetical protein